MILFCTLQQDDEDKCTGYSGTDGIIGLDIVKERLNRVVKETDDKWNIMVIVRQTG